MNPITTELSSLMKFSKDTTGAKLAEALDPKLLKEFVDKVTLYIQKIK